MAGLKRDIESELGGVGTVEGNEALSPVNAPHTFQGRAVGRERHLHSLLYYLQKSR